MAETIRVNKPVSGFGSEKLRENWFLRTFPWVKRILSKNPNEWSDRENEQFMEAMTLAKKLKGVEDRMGLLNPDLDEQIDDLSVGDPEGMLAYKGDDYKGTLGPRWVDTDWSPEVISPPTYVKDDKMDALDVAALENMKQNTETAPDLYKRKYTSNLSKLDSEELDYLAQDNDEATELNSLLADYDEEEEAFDHASGGSSGGSFFASQESGGKSKGLSPMQKYGAKLIMDVFGEKEERPQQSIGASPIFPGRSMDMSKYTTSRRPKRERYRNMGLLGRA